MKNCIDCKGNNSINNEIAMIITSSHHQVFGIQFINFSLALFNPKKLMVN